MKDYNWYTQLSPINLLEYSAQSSALENFFQKKYARAGSIVILHFPRIVYIIFFSVISNGLISPNGLKRLIASNFRHKSAKILKIRHYYIIYQRYTKGYTKGKYILKNHKNICITQNKSLSLQQITNTLCLPEQSNL